MLPYGLFILTWVSNDKSCPVSVIQGFKISLMRVTWHHARVVKLVVALPFLSFMHCSFEVQLSYGAELCSYYDWRLVILTQASERIKMFTILVENLLVQVTLIWTPAWEIDETYFFVVRSYQYKRTMTGNWNAFHGHVALSALQSTPKLLMSIASDACHTMTECSPEIKLQI